MLGKVMPFPYQKLLPRLFLFLIARVNHDIVYICKRLPDFSNNSVIRCTNWLIYDFLMSYKAKKQLFGFVIARFTWFGGIITSKPYPLLR